MKEKRFEENEDFSKYFHEERISSSWDRFDHGNPLKLKDFSDFVEKEDGTFEAPPPPSMYFQCGMCDMLVGEKDDECPFCGAEFMNEDSNGLVYDPEKDEPAEVNRDIGAEEHDTENDSDRDSPEVQSHEASSNASHEPADIVGVREDKAGSPSPVAPVSDATQDGKDIGPLDSKGSSPQSSFTKSAKLIQRMEKTVDKASAFGAETNDARRLLIAAWKACEEGNWNIVTSLADKTEKMLLPNVTNLVKDQVFSLREIILDMKFKGLNVYPHITKIKMIRKAVDEVRIEEAIELTKQLIDETREARKNTLLISGRSSAGS